MCGRCAGYWSASIGYCGKSAKPSYSSVQMAGCRQSREVRFDLRCCVCDTRDWCGYWTDTATIFGVTERGVIPPAERKRLRATERRLGEADTEMRAAVQAAHQAGGSIRSIAAEIGRSTRTIQNWLRTAPADPHG